MGGSFDLVEWRGNERIPAHWLQVCDNIWNILSHAFVQQKLRGDGGDSRDLRGDLGGFTERRKDGFDGVEGFIREFVLDLLGINEDILMLVLQHKLVGEEMSTFHSTSSLSFANKFSKVKKVLAFENVEARFNLITPNGVKHIFQGVHMYEAASRDTLVFIVSPLLKNENGEDISTMNNPPTEHQFTFTANSQHIELDILKLTNSSQLVTLQPMENVELNITTTHPLNSVITFLMWFEGGNLSASYNLIFEDSSNHTHQGNLTWEDANQPLFIFK